MSIVYAIGDVHGQLDLALKVWREIHNRYHRKGEYVSEVIHLGDYIDRGPDSLKILDHLIDWKRQYAAGETKLKLTTLMGNHEQMLRLVLDPKIQEGQKRFAFRDWIENGGWKVLVEAGKEPSEIEDMFGRSTKAIVEYTSSAIGQKYTDFILNELENHVFDERTRTLYVHAGIDPRMDLWRALAEPWHTYEDHHWSWVRDGFITRFDRCPVHPSQENLFTVHGHTIENAGLGAPPIPLPWRLGLDSGAYKREGQVYAAEITDEGISALVVNREHAPTWHEIEDPRQAYFAYLRKHKNLAF